MIRNVSRVAAAVVCFALASSANADQPVEVVPFGEGGLRYSVSPPAMSIDIPAYVQSGSWAHTVPYDSRFRPGCFLSSPTFYVGHDRGYAQFIPVLDASWTGVLYPSTGLHAYVMSLVVSVTKADGSARTFRENLDSGRFPSLTRILDFGNGAILYRATMTNDVLSSRVLQSLEVDSGDAVRVSLCDLAEGTALTVKSLVFQSVPYAG